MTEGELKKRIRYDLPTETMSEITNEVNRQNINRLNEILDESAKEFREQRAKAKNSVEAAIIDELWFKHNFGEAEQK